MRHTFESLQNQKEAKELCEADITEKALEKLMKVTVFMVQKQLHIKNYEDFVQFVEELEDIVLKEYLKLSDSHKNATSI